MSAFRNHLESVLKKGPTPITPRPRSLLADVSGTSGNQPLNSTDVKSVVKNLIRNTSGENGFNGWIITNKGDSGWDIEKKPPFSSAVPTDTFLEVVPKPNETCCFVSSQSLCGKSYLVDLKKELNGLIDSGFEIKCGQFYMARGNSGGEFHWTLRLLNKDKYELKRYSAIYKLPDKGNDNSWMPWKRAEYKLKFHPENEQLTEQIQYLEFLHEAKDEKKNGHYAGMKFARSTVVVVGPNITRKAVTRSNDRAEKSRSLGDDSKDETSKNKKSPTPTLAKLPLKIRTLDGKTCNINAYANWTVKMLKQEFEKCHDVKDAGTCVLQYKARVLNDETVLSDLKMDPDCVLQANFSKMAKPSVPGGAWTNSVKPLDKSRLLIGNCLGVKNGTIPQNVPGIKRGCLMVARTHAETLTLGEVGLTCKIKDLGDTVFVGVKFRKQLVLGSSGIKIQHVSSGDGYCEECVGRKYLYIPVDLIGDSKTHLFNVQ